VVVQGAKQRLGAGAICKQRFGAVRVQGVGAMCNGRVQG
jgi:hypothetical protein